MLRSKGIQKRKAPAFKKSRGRGERFIKPEDTDEGRQSASASKAILSYNTLLEEDNGAHERRDN